MEDNDSFEDSWDNLSWFAYGYLCGEEDGRRPPDPQGEAFGCLAVVVFVVCGVLWALTESVAFAVIYGRFATGRENQKRIGLQPRMRGAAVAAGVSAREMRGGG